MIIREQTAHAVILQTTQQLKQTCEQLVWATQEIEKLKAATALLEHSQQPVRKSARRNVAPVLKYDFSFDCLDTIPEEQFEMPDDPV